MRTLIRVGLGLVVMAFITACDGGKGPTDPPLPPEKSVTISPRGQTFTAIGDSAEASFCAEAKGGVVVGYEWTKDNVRSAVTTKCFQTKLSAGSHTIRVKVFFSDNTVREDATTAMASLTQATLSVKTSDTVVTAKAVQTAVTLEASYNANPNALRWMNAGQQVGGGLRPTLSLPVGTHNLTVTDGTLSAAVRVKVTYGGFEFFVKVACPTGECSASGMKAYISANGREEVVDFPSTQSILIRPSFMDEVSSLRVRLMSPTTGAFVVDIPVDKFFVRQGAVIVEKNWNGVPLSFVTAYEESSSPEGVRSFFLRSYSNGKMLYTLGAIDLSVEQHVLLAGSSYTDPNFSGDYGNWTSSDSLQLLQTLQSVASELNIKIKAISAPGFNSCNAIVVRKLAIGGIGSYSGVSTCDQSNKGKYTGGFVAIDPNQSLSKSFGHEMLHALVGVGHTCSWVSRMGSGCNFTPPASLYSPEDKAYIQARTLVVNLQWKYGADYGIPEMHQGERLVRGMPLENYSVSR